MSDDVRRPLKDRQTHLQQVHFSSQVREQFLADWMPRPDSYTGYDANSGMAIAQTGSGQLRVRPVTNGAIALTHNFSQLKVGGTRSNRMLQ